MKTFGIILIVVGMAMFIFRGFSFTKEKKLVDIGPVELNTKEKKNVSWPSYAAGIAVAAGVIILVASKKK